VLSDVKIFFRAFYAQWIIAARNGEQKPVCWWENRRWGKRLYNERRRRGRPRCIVL